MISGLRPTFQLRKRRREFAQDAKKPSRAHAAYRCVREYVREGFDKVMRELSSRYRAAVIIDILYTSSASQPLLRSLIGAFSPSRIGPYAA